MGAERTARVSQKTGKLCPLHGTMAEEGAEHFGRHFGHIPERERFHPLRRPEFRYDSRMAFGEALAAV